MASLVSKLVSRRVLLRSAFFRHIHTEETPPPPPPPIIEKKGLVIGIYSDEDGAGCLKFTPNGSRYNGQTGGKLGELLLDNPKLHLGDTQIFRSLECEYPFVAVVGLGQEDACINPNENLDEGRENARIASGAGIRALRKLGVTCVSVESMGYPEASAEGAGLAAWRFQDYKNIAHREPPMSVRLYDDEGIEDWNKGLLKAESQNLARLWADIPANLMTPPDFVQAAADALCPLGINVEARNIDWIEAKGMGGFVGVAKGSCEPPLLLEICYLGGGSDDKPVTFVGKGVTFDAGGLCIKHCEGMAEFRGDMSGAAVVVAVIRAAACLRLPINITAVIPLVENMPSGKGLKPGDVLMSYNCKSIRVDHTANEGRILMADGLNYAQGQYKPCLLIGVATMTDGMKAGLGGGASGVFSTNNDVWKYLEDASVVTGDRVWRFPLWSYYKRRVLDLDDADITNLGSGPGGGPCRSAAFLREFIPCIDWLQLDISGTGLLSHPEDVPYLEYNRMTGRPTRTLIEFLCRLALNPVKKDCRIDCD